jgi:serine/threonine-protein kinase
MEFVDGENLKSILHREGPLPIEQALAITLQVCEALRHAHQRGVIHRDIKPEKVLIAHEGVVKLADLGLAKRIESGRAEGLTKAGSIFGTPFYMAPEQAKNFSDVDQRSDIYSLVVTLYKALSGKVPFDGRSPIEIMVKALDGKRPNLRALRAEVPERVGG